MLGHFYLPTKLFFGTFSLTSHNNGNISARDAGKIGGNMVRKMIQQAENQMIGK